MLHSCLILAAVLPMMLCDEARGAGLPPHGAVSYASYHAEWGENLTPLIAKSIHLELSRNRNRLNVSLHGGMPPLVYTGPVDDTTFKEIFDLLHAMDAASWPGSTGRDDKGTRHKDRCEWSVFIGFRETGHQEVRVYGADTGRDTPRLEAEKQLCDYLKTKLPELHASVPKRLESLSLSDNPTGDYWSVRTNDGRVEICCIAKGQPKAEFYADPAVLQELRALLDKSGAEAWHGFGHDAYAPGKMPIHFSVEYSTRQPVVVMAEPGHMPEGFAGFCNALRATLGPLVRRWQEVGTAPAGGLKRFHFNENGMRMASPHYAFYRRLDAEGARAHISRVRGDDPDGDVPLSVAEEQELATILRGLAAWDGFDGNARNVLDAPGFTFSVEFADGKTIKARGYGKSPRGYREGREALLDFIEKHLPTPSRDR